MLYNGKGYGLFWCHCSARCPSRGKRPLINVGSRERDGVKIVRVFCGWNGGGADLTQRLRCSEQSRCPLGLPQSPGQRRQRLQGVGDAQISELLE